MRGLKLHQGTFRLDIGRKFCTRRVIRYLRGLPGEVVEGLLQEMVKGSLDVAHRALL